MAVHPLRPATDRCLGGPLPHQLANQTRVHLIPPECFHTVSCDTVRLCGFTSRFQLLSPCMRQVTHALLTRPPLDRISASTDLLSFDLHVLSTPPAFILSQDQTLIKKFVNPMSEIILACIFPNHLYCYWFVGSLISSLIRRS